MKSVLSVTAVLPLFFLCGCPNSGESEIVTPVITASSTSIEPGDAVAFDASSSTSKNTGALTYEWDFAGDETATTVTAIHTFDAPGRYVVTLTVTDSTGETATTTVDIRVRGEVPTARIVASATSGPATLVVQFDGSTSTAPDDEIQDYIWEFGDGETSTGPTPIHGFIAAGTYTVTLTVRTYGGVEDEATVTIEVEESPNHSLQFGGSECVLLALGSSLTLTNWTFETWVNPTSTGGPVVSSPDGLLSLEVLPSTNKIAFQAGGATDEIAVTSMANGWHHIALVNQASGNVNLYVDGVLRAQRSASGQVTAAQLNLGVGFYGKIAEVRMWTEVRTLSEILANYDTRLSNPSSEANLLGYWQIDEGYGQLLENLGTGGYSGMLGVSTGTDSNDPAWSTDGPDL